MPGNTLLLAILMAGLASPTLPSQYAFPAAVPLRFNLPGGYIDVRSSTTSYDAYEELENLGKERKQVSIADDDEEFEEEGPMRGKSKISLSEDFDTGELDDVGPSRGDREISVIEDEDTDGVRVLKYKVPKKKRRKTRHKSILSKLDRRYKSLENPEEYKQISSWAVPGPKRRRNRFNKRGNMTSRSRVPKNKYKKKNIPPGNARRHPHKKFRKSGSTPNRRKSTSPNRPTGGVPAGGRYRSVDPRQKKVRRHILRFHNILRSHVEPPAADMLAVGWYETAAEQAQNWAEQCGAHTDADHPSVRWTSRYGACGQNVLVAPRKRRWSYVLRRWWSGRRNFRFGDDTNNSSAVSAYTQMAWYNSHQLGCGFAECSTTGGSTFFRYVCNYCPAGNDPRRLSRPYTRGQSCRRCPNSCRPMCSRGQCKLCTNACTYSDLWVNCATLDKKWHEWLCNTKTTQGVERFKNCRATCQCMKSIT